MLAISPEKPDITMKSVDIEKLSFTILSDGDNVLAEKVGLVYQIPQMLKFLYRLMGINVDRSQHNKEGKLPISATYVCNENGVITHAWVDVDYTNRAEPSEVLRAYRTIEKKE